VVTLRADYVIYDLCRALQKRRKEGHSYYLLPLKNNMYD
jgi:hypothetical protein